MRKSSLCIRSAFSCKVNPLRFSVLIKNPISRGVRHEWAAELWWEWGAVLLLLLVLVLVPTPSLIVCGHYRDGNSFITTFRLLLLPLLLLHPLLRLLQSERESDAFVVAFVALGLPHKYLFYGLVLWTPLLLRWRWRGRVRSKQRRIDFSTFPIISPTPLCSHRAGSQPIFWLFSNMGLECKNGSPRSRAYKVMANHTQRYLNMWRRWT